MLQRRAVTVCARSRETRLSSVSLPMGSLSKSRQCYTMCNAQRKQQQTGKEGNNKERTKLLAGS